METLQQLLEQTEQKSNTSTKLFMLEKAIAELTGTQLVLKEQVSKLTAEVFELRSNLNGTPKVGSNEIKLTSNNDLVSSTDNKPFMPDTTYYSTIKRIMEVKEYEHVGKKFQKYLVELVEKGGVYEIHRDMELRPIEQGMRMSHVVEGSKIKRYRIQYQ
jgi:glutamine synthetase adenylyltransferase